jgi:2,5-diketo-D-gluconate reductase A
MNKLSNVNLRTGNLMPVLGLGTWQMDKDTPGAIVKALEIGYRMIDTSGDYGTQEGIGDGLLRSREDRASYYIVTKVEETDDAYEATIQNLDELQLAYVNLMLIHRPPEDSSGVKLWRDLIRAKNEGLVVDIGVSNYSSEQIQDLIDATGQVPVVNQVEWTPFGYNEDLLDYCIDNKIIVQAYSPLTRARRLDDGRLAALAYKYNKTPAQIIIRWNLQIGTVPIIKANQASHMREDIDVFDFKIHEDDMSNISQMNEEYSFFR